jgi:hypothetical protein
MNDAIQKIQFQTRREKNKQTDSGKYHYVDVDWSASEKYLTFAIL